MHMNFCLLTQTLAGYICALFVLFRILLASGSTEMGSCGCVVVRHLALCHGELSSTVHGFIAEFRTPKLEGFSVVPYVNLDHVSLVGRKSAFRPSFSDFSPYFKWRWRLFTGRPNILHWRFWKIMVSGIILFWHDQFNTKRQIWDNFSIKLTKLPWRYNVLGNLFY